MATQFICQDKRCNPLYPLIGEVKLHKKFVNEPDSVRCKKCKRSFQESEMDKEYHHKVCGGEIVPCKVAVLYCPKCEARKKAETFK